MRPAISFMCHWSMALSWASLASDLPWWERLWYASVSLVSPSSITGEFTLSSSSAMDRVESVSKASRARSYMRRTFSMYSRGLAGIERARWR
jgi:hypothetical protein